MARWIITHTFKMAQFPEPATRRLAALFQHGLQFVAHLDQFVIGGTDRMFGQDGRCRLTQRAGFRVDRDGFNNIAVLRQFHIDPYRRAANPRDFRG